MRTFIRVIIRTIIWTSTLSGLLFSAVTHACTPDACLTTGHFQDTLLLGKVVSLSKKTNTVKIFYVFPQNKLAEIKLGQSIQLKKYSFLAQNKKKELSINKNYLFSLNKKSSIYQIKWGAYQVKGNHYSEMRLVEKTTWASPELEEFIRTGGKKKLQ